MPAAFRSSVELHAHQRAADNTLAKARLAHWQIVAGAVILLGWTLFGGLDVLNATIRDAIAPRAGALAYQVARRPPSSSSAHPRHAFRVVLDVSPRAALRFQPMTWRLWLADTAKGLALGAVIGIPLLAAVLWIMGAAGTTWWLWAG